MHKLLFLILIFLTGLTTGAAEVVEISSAFVRDLEQFKEVRSFEHLLTRLTNSRNRRNCRLQLEFGNSTAKPELRTDFSSLPWRAVLSGGGAWKQDLHLAAKLGGLLAGVHAGATGKEAAKPLPLWLTAALFQQMQEQNRTERYFSHNRRFPVVGTLLQNGYTLNLKAFAGEEFATPANSAERFWQQEFGRLLLDLVLNFPPENFGVQIPFFKKRARVSPKRTSSKFSDEELPAFVWHDPEFVPFSVWEKEVQELRKIQISALDKEGVPSGESVEITIEQLPEKLKKHPESKNILSLYGRRIQAFCRRVPGELAKPFSQLGSAVWKLNESHDAAKQLYQAWRSCKQAMQLRKKRAAVLDETWKNYSGAERYAPVFWCNWSFSMLNEKEKALLSETERFFSK